MKHIAQWIFLWYRIKCCTVVSLLTECDGYIPQKNPRDLQSVFKSGKMEIYISKLILSDYVLQNLNWSENRKGF